MSRRARFSVPAIFIIAAMLFLWPITFHPGYIPVRSGAESDLLISHLPNAVYIRESLSHYGQLPLWNTQIMSGQPFAADPLSGLWYLPNLLLLFLPLPFAFTALFVLHLAWGGYGVFQYVRSEGLSTLAALFGGLAFTATPKVIAHLAAGHVSLIFAVAWTPWLLLVVKRAAGGSIKQAALAGAIVSAIFLADVRWAFYAGCLGIVYWAACVLGPGRDAKASRNSILKAALAGFLVCVMLCAILMLPLAEFIRYSNRSNFTLAEVSAYSLPPWPYLLGMFIPVDGVIHEWVTYMGVLPMLLAVFGAFRGRKWFWPIVIIMAAAFSLGTNFFLFSMLFNIVPVIGFLRIPPRAWFVVSLGVAILSAYGMQILLVERPSYARFPLLSRLMPGATRLFAVCLFITAFDLLRTNNTLMSSQPLPRPSQAAQWIASQPGIFRVYSPSSSLPLPDDLQHAEGVDPLHLASYDAYMARASGISSDGYSVSVPSFFVKSADLEPERAALASHPNPDLLGALNVKYIAAEFPLNVSGLVLVQTLGTTYIYENQRVLPRVRVNMGTAELKELTPNRIVIEAIGPATLTISEIIYPGWEVWVDDVQVNIETKEDMLRGVQVASGAHTVTFEFRPISFYAGVLITLFGLLLLLVIWRWAK